MIGGIMKKILIGRDFQFIDKLIFKISRGKTSGWVIGNKIRSFIYGRKKKISTENIILIGCFPRSGSTLLRTLLGQHPNIIAGEDEVHIFQDIKTPSKIYRAFNINPEKIKEIKKGAKDLVEFSEKLFKEIKKGDESKRVLLKQPKHILFLKDIFKHYPKAKFIHIIRDGRDCTMSQRYYLLPPNRKEWPYEWCCRQWVTFINHGKKFRKDPRYLEVKYEDLVRNPYKTLKRITDFLGLDKIPKKNIDNAHKNFNVEKRPDHKEVGKPIDRKRIGKWKNKMSEKDKKIFKKIAGETLIELGYEKDYNW